MRLTSPTCGWCSRAATTTTSPGRPGASLCSWTLGGEQEQRRAIADIFTGRLGGTPCKQLPWVFKDANLLGVEALDIEIDHTPGRGWFRAGGEVEVRMRGPVPDQGIVTCMIPGHKRHGRELFTESLDVDTGSLVFSVQGRCAYETTFEYSSDDG